MKQSGSMYMMTPGGTSCLGGGLTPGSSMNTGSFVPSASAVRMTVILFFSCPAVTTDMVSVLFVSKVARPGISSQTGISSMLPINRSS